MKSHSALCLLLILFSVLLPETGRAEEKAPASARECRDVLEAREWCDAAPLLPIEGIWQFPDEEATVLIAADAGRSDGHTVYNLYVMDSADCRLLPGDVLGQLTESPDPDVFSLRMYSKKAEGILTNPLSCAAKFDSRKESLTITRLDFKLRINPMYLLPGFWKIARISVGKSNKVPAGLTKVYPGYDGNGSSRRKPRYL